MAEWHKQYGPIFSLKLGSGTLVVINDREAIRELWEKRSQNYSDRTPMYVAGLLTKFHHAVFNSANETWRDRRKVISQYYSPQKCDRDHAAYQDAESVLPFKKLLIRRQFPLTVLYIEPLLSLKA